VHSSAGTKHPIYAIIANKQVYRSNVLLPPILGPVINKVKCLFKLRSFGMNGFFSVETMQGCLIAFTSKIGLPLRSLFEIILGLHSLTPGVLLIIARELRQSISDTQLQTFWNI
jgi:hypothetical protein